MITSNHEALANGLCNAVSRHLGLQTTIKNLSPVSGGASADIWQFDALCDGQRYELILRQEAKRDQSLISNDRATEADLLDLAQRAGVPVPKVRFVLKEEDDLGMGYIMDRLEGESIARKILRDEKYSDARAKMAKQCGKILARIHSIDTSLLPPLKELPAGPSIEVYESLYRSFGEDRPVFEVAFRWLKDNMPGPSPLQLVHGDFRNGNFIVTPEGIRAVLDWEISHLGDAMEDLGWLCINSWRFGNIDKPVGGFGDMADLFDGYEDGGGLPVDPEMVHFWQVFGSLKWGVLCLFQAFTHLKGEQRSVELPAVGRRVSETEIDLLNLLS